MPPRAPSALLPNGRPCTLCTFYCIICLPFPSLRLKECLLPQHWGQLRRTSLFYSVARPCYCCCFLLPRPFFSAFCQQHKGECLLPFRPPFPVSLPFAVLLLRLVGFVRGVRGPATFCPFCRVIDRISTENKVGLNAGFALPRQTRRNISSRGPIPAALGHPILEAPRPAAAGTIRRRRAGLQRLSAAGETPGCLF